MGKSYVVQDFSAKSLCVCLTRNQTPSKIADFFFLRTIFQLKDFSISFLALLKAQSIQYVLDSFHELMKWTRQLDSNFAEFNNETFRLEKTNPANATIAH